MIQHPERTQTTLESDMGLTDDIITRLDSFIEILLAKDRDVEQARIKVTQDVEKLIQNQESFERRVAEMDSVYAMLMSEQKKLKEKKRNIDLVFGKTQQSCLPSLKYELGQIKEENQKLRNQVTSAIEEEVRRLVSQNQGSLVTQRRKSNVDMPRQMDDKFTHKSHSNTLNTASTITPAVQKELSKREDDLKQWEQSLFAKSIQIEDAMQQYQQKMQRMTTQKQEITLNVRKLQSLTKDYQRIIEAEEKTTSA